MNSIFNKLITSSLLAIKQKGANICFESTKISATHRVSNLEKRFLVWTGKFKNIEEVPAYVQQNVMERARNRMRIRIANYMMAATLLACVGMAILGKQAAKKGESVQKENLEWHRVYNEEGKPQ